VTLVGSVVPTGVSAIFRGSSDDSLPSRSQVAARRAFRVALARARVGVKRTGTCVYECVMRNGMLTGASATRGIYAPLCSRLGSEAMRADDKSSACGAYNAEPACVCQMRCSTVQRLRLLHQTDDCAWRIMSTAARHKLRTKQRWLTWLNLRERLVAADDVSGAY
jgi:hypothetical protein